MCINLLLLFIQTKLLQSTAECTSHIKFHPISFHLKGNLFLNMSIFLIFMFNRKWINDSYAYWDNLRLREDASLSGVTQLSAYAFSSTNPSTVRVGKILSNAQLAFRLFINRKLIKKKNLQFLH